MVRKRKTPPPNVQSEEEKPTLAVKNEVSDEEDELESEEEIEEVEESESEAEESSEEDEDEDEDEDEEEDEGSKRKALRKLLEPLGKDQIIEYLKEAALKDRAIFARISQLAESDPSHRKIFIHGLGWDATSEQVHSVFKQYGDIEEYRVVTDKVTGRSKGYGFVLFKTRGSAQKALKEPQKQIGCRMTSCQFASTGPVSINPVLDSNGRKIFVTSVGPHVNPVMLRLFFEKFGEIEEGPLGFNEVTGKFNGNAIFVYKTAEGCKKALEEPIKVFASCQLQCRGAVAGRKLYQKKEGLRTNKNQTVVSSSSSVAANAMQQSDISTLNYGVAVHPGIYGPNVNPAAVLLGQNSGFRLANPMLVSAFNQTGFTPSVATGMSQAIRANQSLGFSGNYNINSLSPSVIGSYASQAALQGLGAYQSAQLGHSSVGAIAAVAARPQSGFGSVGTTFPSHFGR